MMPWHNFTHNIKYFYTVQSSIQSLLSNSMDRTRTLGTNPNCMHALVHWHSAALARTAHTAPTARTAHTARMAPEARMEPTARMAHMPRSRVS